MAITTRRSALASGNPTGAASPLLSAGRAVVLAVAALAAFLLLAASASAATGGGLTTGLLGQVSPAAQAGETCWDGRDPTTFRDQSPNSIRTLRQVDDYYGRKIELRVHLPTDCVWGKVTNGKKNDHVWVDRSTNGGASWVGKLGIRKISSGTSQYSLAYRGAGYELRACANIGGAVHTSCTGWV